MTVTAHTQNGSPYKANNKINSSKGEIHFPEKVLGCLKKNVDRSAFPRNLTKSALLSNRAAQKEKRAIRFYHSVNTQLSVTTNSARYVFF